MSKWWSTLFRRSFTRRQPRSQTETFDRSFVPGLWDTCPISSMHSIPITHFGPNALKNTVHSDRHAGRAPSKTRAIHKLQWSSPAGNQFSRRNRTTASLETWHLLLKTLPWPLNSQGTHCYARRDIVAAPALGGSWADHMRTLRLALTPGKPVDFIWQGHGAEPAHPWAAGQKSSADLLPNRT